MSHDPRLAQLESVRQRRHEDATRVMQQHRAWVMEGLRDAETAQQAVNGALTERAAFIARLRDGATQGGVSVSGLLDAQGWQAAFDARIAQPFHHPGAVLLHYARGVLVAPLAHRLKLGEARIVAHGFASCRMACANLASAPAKVSSRMAGWVR